MKVSSRSLELRSRVSSSGAVQLSIVEVDVPAPVADEILVRVEGAPINPTDMGLMFGLADISKLEASGIEQRRTATAPVAPAAMQFLSLRVDRSMPIGVEGAGTVIAAGASAEHMLGKKVCVTGDGCFAQIRKAKASDCLVLPDDVTAAEGAAAFVNPMTALGMIETVRGHGQNSFVHTAAASNLGRMLIKLCADEGIQLVNVVRRPDQVEELRSLGCSYVCDSSADDFRDQLASAIDKTGAMTAFDAVGGKLTGRIMSTMEAVAARSATTYSRYGTSVTKRVYSYGGLDPSPIEIGRGVGLRWSVSGWLLYAFLEQAGIETVERMRDRVRAELRTTFSAAYAGVLSLSDALRPEIIAQYGQRRTGHKFLINPQLPLS